MMRRFFPLAAGVAGLALAAALYGPLFERPAQAGHDEAADVAAKNVRQEPAEYRTGVFRKGTNTYSVLDKGAAAADASIVFRDRRNARAEIGITGDAAIHFKTATGTYPNERFIDRMIISVGGGVDVYQGLLRNYATSGTASIVAGNSNFRTGAGLEMSYEFAHMLSRITSAEHGNTYRPLVLEGDGIQFNTGTDSVAEAARFTSAGHLAFTGAAPTLSSCGSGSPALDATASDNAGTITEGTTATGCTATFAVAFATPPHCIVSSPSGSAFASYSTSTTALTIVNASATGDRFTYHCTQ